MTVYLDHHAATPLLPEALAAMTEARRLAWANPSSVHQPGRAARKVVEDGRRALAAALGARPRDLVFTSGGTEACNLGISGLGRATGAPARRVLLGAIEHPAVGASVEALAATVIPLPVVDGQPPEPSVFRKAVAGVDLACVQWVNHETGTVFPIEAYAAICRELGVRLFVDACQAPGKLRVDLDALGASAVAVASSKIGGPPGVGALWIDSETELRPLLVGGGQERGRRAGSLDPAAVAGFGAAASCLARKEAGMIRLAQLRDRLEARLLEHGVINGGRGPRVATVVNASVRGWEGPRLVAALDLEGLAVSHGAACSSGTPEPSRVVAAMYPEEPWRASSALRLSLGPSTTDAEVDEALRILDVVIRRKFV